MLAHRDPDSGGRVPGDAACASDVLRVLADGEEEMMMRLATIIPVALWIAALGLSVPADAQTPVWSDEFVGTSVDPNNWEFMIGNGCEYGNCGWGNNELEYYTSRPENCYVSGGNLHIVARREAYAGFQFTSTRMRSLNRQDFLYGRMEARIKLPTGGGMWPAFWMMPSDSVYGGWAASGEIDIVESINTATTVYGTIHYGGQWPNNTNSGGSYANGTNFSQDFHIYALDWTPDEMRWYIDGVLYYTATSAVWYSAGAPANPRAPFDQYFHFLMNVAVGGNWPGCTQPSCVTASLPQELVVDWVRVYEIAEPVVEITSPADGANLPPGNITIEATASESGGTIASVEFYVNGVFLGDDTTVPYTYTWNAPNGCYALRATAVDAAGRSADDTISVVVGTGCSGQPYHGYPLAIPGRIEAEDFNLGAEGVAYHDCTTGNSGGAYRPTSDVDIEGCSEGGFNIGWMCAGEWMNYSVQVLTPGTYTIQTRVASQSSGGTFHVEFDQVDKTGAIAVPSTGGWQSWVTVTATADLTAGAHLMKFANSTGTGSYNVNYFNCVLTYPLGDIDHDGNVDSADGLLLLAAMAGPGVTTPPVGCTPAQFDRSDLDGDGDVDVRDVAAFQNFLVG
jgi:beta-glucanase (GH16 family)